MIKEGLKKLSITQLLLSILTLELHFISYIFLCLPTLFLAFIPKIPFEMGKSSFQQTFYHFLDVNSKQILPLS